MNKDMDRVMEAVNRAAVEVFGEDELRKLFGVQKDPKLTFQGDGRYFYYTPRLTKEQKKGRMERMYCHSKGKNLNGKYISWIYTRNKHRKTVKMSKLCEHKKKKAAIGRALRMCRKEEREVNDS